MEVSIKFSLIIRRTFEFLYAIHHRKKYGVLEKLICRYFHFQSIVMKVFFDQCPQTPHELSMKSFIIFFWLKMIKAFLCLSEVFDAAAQTGGEFISLLLNCFLLS